MKRQIRLGVFETNSSSEHSLAIVNLDKFRKWKNGELVARVSSIHEDDNCWGNFWSEMLNLEFTDDFEQAKAENENIVKNVIDDHIKENEEYKQRCQSYVPRLKNKLTVEERNKLSEAELEKYMEDEYHDSMYHFDEPTYEYYKNLYENMDMKDFEKHFGIWRSNMWMTFQEFWDSYIEHDDCYSPFEHDDLANNVHIIGKYFHS